MVLEMYRTNGVEYISFATCNVSFKDLLDPSLTNDSNCLKYYNDLISTTDNKTIIGNIEYTIRAMIPMNQAIKAYKDRSLALNLLSNTTTSSIEPPISANTRQQYNELTIEIIECQNIKSKDNEKYKNPFVAYKFYIYDEVITDTIWGNLSPKFNNVNKIMLSMSPSLDRYLRTSSLSIAVFNDDKTEENYIFGVANIPLSELANNNSIHGLFDINDDDQNKVGQILVNIEWDKDYSVEPIPLISKYDEYIAKNENSQKNKKHIKEKERYLIIKVIY
ncbi:C2 domain-containing protein [Neocallimastix lanati (nom. inval.)]|nr:C2 domain-containing protein [Neocallimastix sp. JGI-2020a]